MEKLKDLALLGLVVYFFFWLPIFSLWVSCLCNFVVLFRTLQHSIRDNLLTKQFCNLEVVTIFYVDGIKEIVISSLYHKNWNV